MPLGIRKNILLSGAIICALNWIVYAVAGGKMPTPSDRDLTFVNRSVKDVTLWCGHSSSSAKPTGRKNSENTTILHNLSTKA